LLFPVELRKVEIQQVLRRQEAKFDMMVMSLEVLLLFGVVGYLVGSFSFSRLFLRIFAPDVDVSKLTFKAEGGEEMTLLGLGANNLSTVLGSKISMIVSTLDILKVALPMLALRLYYGGDLMYIVFSITALLGNNWSLYYRFKGGTGFSVTLGSLAVIDWFTAISAPILGFFTGVFAFANIGFANIGWIVLLVPILWLRTFDTAILIYSIILNVIMLLALLPEAKRFMEYSRQGKLEGLAKSYYDSYAMARGMKKIFTWKENLGSWKYLIMFLMLVIFFLFFGLLYLYGGP
jgi:glycerol-3-phosphate acyltransferase PlsY